VRFIIIGTYFYLFFRIISDFQFAAVLATKLFSFLYTPLSPPPHDMNISTSL